MKMETMMKKDIEIKTNIESKEKTSKAPAAIIQLPIVSSNSIFRRPPLQTISLGLKHHGTHLKSNFSLLNLSEGMAIHAFGLVMD